MEPAFGQSEAKMVETRMRIMPRQPAEAHYMTRIGWLRAAVLGANDGLLSTSSVMVGVAATAPGVRQVLMVGVAALVAGAMSMAAGEYVSVSSQSDTEAADLDRERQELMAYPEAERRELAAIYVRRGLAPELAATVAEQLMVTDALGAHARDELGITDASSARPVQAALASATSFAAGGLWPVVTATLVPVASIVPAVALVALLVLAVLGAVGARAGGAPPARAAVRVVVWGAIAMAVTFGVGRTFGAVFG